MGKIDKLPPLPDWEFAQHRNVNSYKIQNTKYNKMKVEINDGAC